jgi:hypothetical protein
MKTLTSHLTRLATITAIAAMSAAGFTLQSARAAERELRVVQLPMVVVTGKRIPIVTFETVVVTAKRGAPQNTVVAQRGARVAPV